MIKGVLILALVIGLTLSIENVNAYQKLGKNTKAYYYTQSRPYWERPNRQWDRRAYKSYFYYGHDVLPQYTYTYPGHYYYYGYPYYYDNDQGRIYSYWGY